MAKRLTGKEAVAPDISGSTGARRDMHGRRQPLWKRSERDDVIFAIYGEEPAEMAKRLLLAAGIENAVPQGGRIALKPNLVVARPASEGATTHPEIVAGIVEFFKERGYNAIDIIEGSWVGDDTTRAFAASGMDSLAKRYGVRLYDLKKDGTVSVPTPLGEVKVCRRALETDFLVNIPVLKGHCQTWMTCALKNMKGCIPDSEKRRFHRDGLHEWIAALATAITADVVVVDGLCGDLDFEEGGNPVQANRMFLAGDPVAMDAYGCELLGAPVSAVEYIGLAERYGVGSAAVSPDRVTQLNRPAPAAASASGKVRRLARHVEADQACSACYANTIHALKRLEERGTSLADLPALHVGQGWRGKAFGGIGVGSCCRGGNACVPGCPPSASEIVKTVMDASAGG